jgi:hypothetical protein
LRERCRHGAGKANSGAAMRWTFTDIKPDSFHWIGERSLDDGASWQLQAEYFAPRAQGGQRDVSECLQSLR